MLENCEKQQECTNSTKFVQTFSLTQSHTIQNVDPNEAVQCIFLIVRVEMKIVATTFADQNF